MSFQPKPFDIIEISGIPFRIAEHPSAPGYPYAQEGRTGIIYQLIANEPKALKVFRQRFITPKMVSLANSLHDYATIPGLSVCDRLVLTPSQSPKLLQQHPELTFAVCMPWIEGTTWQEIVMTKQSLLPEKSINLTCNFCRILVSLEQKSIAHGDLSPSNIIISPQQDQIELVDVEGMYAPNLSIPEALTPGSPGYAHKSNTTGIWDPTSDRFAGAIILAEMLMASSPEFGSLSYGESFFSPKEIQTDCQRYQKVKQTLRASYGSEIADLFITTWQSSTLNDCPTFAQWQNVVCSVKETSQPILSDSSQKTEVEGAILVSKWQLTQEISSIPETEHRKDQVHYKAGELPPKIIPPIPPAISYPPDETKKLFDTGYWAYQRHNWLKADRTLGIVVSRNPDFALYGVRADTLLAQAKLNMQSKPIKKKTPVFLWVSLGLFAFVLFIILVTYFTNG